MQSMCQKTSSKNRYIYEVVNKFEFHYHFRHALNSSAEFLFLSFHRDGSIKEEQEESAGIDTRLCMPATDIERECG